MGVYAKFLLELYQCTLYCNISLHINELLTFHKDAGTGQNPEGTAMSRTTMLVELRPSLYLLGKDENCHTFVLNTNVFCLVSMNWAKHIYDYVQVGIVLDKPLDPKVYVKSTEVNTCW